MEINDMASHGVIFFNLEVVKIELWTTFSAALKFQLS